MSEWCWPAHFYGRPRLPQFSYFYYTKLQSMMPCLVSLNFLPSLSRESHLFCHPLLVGYLTIFSCQCRVLLCQDLGCSHLLLPSLQQYLPYHSPTGLGTLAQLVACCPRILGGGSSSPRQGSFVRLSTRGHCRGWHHGGELGWPGWCPPEKHNSLWEDWNQKL